ncbi:hypothetical protein D3C78_1625990 [compost metagenome]
MVTSSSSNRNTVSAVLKSFPYSNGITRGATTIRTKEPNSVKVVLILNALKVREMASSFDSSEALGNSTTVMELEKNVTIRDKLTATT